MSMIEDCVRSWIRSSTSSTWAWIVTSSAVVGSSAMSRSGSFAIAIAIMARWRIPPEYSCGYWSTRWVGFGMPDDLEQLDRASPSLRGADVLMDRRSPLRSACPPSGPGSARRARPGRPSRSSSPAPCPASSPATRGSARRGTATWPVIVAEVGRSPRIAIEVTLLPDPDSPTMPSVSLWWTSNETWSTARSRPSSVLNSTVRSRTESTGTESSVIRGAVPSRVISTGWRSSSGAVTAQCFSDCGSNASRRPSPMKFTASTVIRIMIPGT